MTCAKIVTYLEVQNDGPDETEGELRVAVDDVLRPDVDQFDFLVAQKVERHLGVLQHVEAHFSLLPWLES